MKILQRIFGNDSAGRTPPADIEIVPHDKITDEHVRSFMRMMERQGQVCNRGLADRIRQAYRLGFLRLDGEVIGIGAIKHPLDSYLESLSQKTGKNISYKYEIGWFFIAPDYRGALLATTLGERLGEGIERVLATTRSHNRVVRFMMSMNGFRRIGCYPSELGDYDVILYEYKRE